MATTLKRVDKIISSNGYVVNVNEVGSLPPPIADGHSVSASEALLLGGYITTNSFTAQRSKRSFADFSVSTDWGTMAKGRAMGGAASNGTYYIWGGGYNYTWRQEPTKNVYWGSFTTNSTEVRLPDVSNNDSGGGNYWNNCVSNESECIVGGGQTTTTFYTCCNSSDQYNFYSKEKTVTTSGATGAGYKQYGQASNGTIGKFTGGYYGNTSSGGNTANSRGYHFSDRSISQSFPNLTQAKMLQSSGSNATIELILGGYVDTSNNIADVERYSFDEKTYNVTAGELSVSHSHSFGCSDGNVVYAARNYSRPSTTGAWANNGIAKAFDSNVSMVTAAGISNLYYHSQCSGN